jgi:hypothetical protein
LIVYRALAYHAPLWIEPNYIEGRFNRANAGPVQYFCEHPLGPLAEALRRVPDGLDPAHVRRHVWALQVPDEQITTLGFDEAAEWGIDPYALVCPPEGYWECQDLAETLLAKDEPPLLRVPSASLPGTWNVIAFGHRVIAPYMTAIVDPYMDVPGALTAVDARALQEVVPLIRPLGALDHAAYDAWHASRPYAFQDPPLPLLSLGG